MIVRAIWLVLENGAPFRGCPCIEKPYYLGSWFLIFGNSHIPHARRQSSIRADYLCFIIAFRRSSRLLREITTVSMWRLPETNEL